jgi:hypothetical protein
MLTLELSTYLRSTYGSLYGVPVVLTVVGSDQAV